MDNVTNKTGQLDKKLTDILLTPSWLSGLVAVFSGLLLTAGVIVASDVNNSQVQQQLTTLQSTTTSALTLPGGTPSAAGNHFLQTSWPLLVFWGFVGLAVYFVVEAIVGAVRNAAELKEELGYINTRPHELLRTAAQHLLLRLLAIIVWFIFIDIFSKRIIPYSITAAHASTANLLSLSAVLYILLSFTMIALSMHVNAILLRLAVRRPRVFTRASYL